MKNGLYGIVLAVLFMGFTACGGGGESSSGTGSSSSETGSDSSATDTGTVTGTVSLADGVTLSLSNGRFLNVQSPNGIRVYIDGDDSLYGDTDSNGSFTISNVPVGTKCIKASAQAQSNQTYGFRKCYTVTTSGTEVGAVAMEEAGSLSGTATLDNASDSEGVLVYAAGTSYDARTNASGAFTISDMSPGEYDVTISKDGYTTRKYTSVIINPGENTRLGSLVLLEGESCTEGGAVLAVTSTSQSEDTIGIGESVTFSIEACSSLDLEIDYTWYEENCGDSSEGSLGSETSYTFTSNDSDGGSTQQYCVKAEIDNNNLDVVTYYVHVRNNNYFEHVARYETHVSPEETFGIGKYGDYLYIQGIVGSQSSSALVTPFVTSKNVAYGKVEIVDISDPENPEYVDELEYDKGADNFVSGMFVQGDKMFVQMCETDGTKIYMYDLSNDPTSPILLTTLTNADISNSGDSDCIVDYGYGGEGGELRYDGRYLYVPVGGVINIVDLVAPSSPVISATIEASSGGYRPTMVYDSDYLIVANVGNFNLDVWNVSNRSSPSLTTTYDDSWDASGTGGGPAVLYSDSGKIYVSHDSYGLDVLNLTNLPTITAIEKLGNINEEGCGGTCSAHMKIHNVGGYTLFVGGVNNSILVYDEDDLGTLLGDIHSYVSYFSPDIVGILSDDDYIYVVHGDGVDIFRMP